MRIVYIIIGAVIGAVLAAALTYAGLSVANPDFYTEYDGLGIGALVGLVAGATAGSVIWSRQEESELDGTARRGRLGLIWLASILIAVPVTLWASNLVGKRQSTPPSDEAMAGYFTIRRAGFDALGQYLGSGKGATGAQFEGLVRGVGLTKGESRAMPGVGALLVYWSGPISGPLATDYARRGFAYMRRTPPVEQACTDGDDGCGSIQFHRITGHWYTFEAEIEG